MIGSLAGVLTQKSPPALVVEVGGVGYELEAPMSTFYGLPPIGHSVRLLTHLLVREDAHILYGFGSAGERQLFRSLLKVSGVGPRIALAILSGSSAEAFAASVQVGDVAALTKIPGVGRKIAERLVVEMRDRLAGAGTEAQVAAIAAPVGVAAEAYSALLALGYKPLEATRLLKSTGGAGSTEELIRGALQSAARE
ncbi:MAG: Holliday junction branch migration protein RuvA [Gammaproteobacteria bacterium]|nr:Holliday junction branch migration protein RuvA [Gammaproteobacteria bacterium]